MIPLEYVYAIAAALVASLTGNVILFFALKANQTMLAESRNERCRFLLALVEFHNQQRMLEEARFRFLSESTATLKPTTTEPIKESNECEPH